MVFHLNLSQWDADADGSTDRHEGWNSYVDVVMHQLGDMGKRGNFGFDPTLLKNEILSQRLLELN